MTYIVKNVYFNVLDDIVKNYNNTIHTSIEMKPKDVKNNNLTEYFDKFNKKDPNFKIGDYVRISKLNCMLNGRDMIIVLIVGYIKRTYYK